MKKLLLFGVVVVILLSLSACAKAPDPTAEPTPAAPAAYAGEDTFVISLDGEDFVISAAGLAASPKEVCDFYGYEHDLSDEQAAAWANGPVPPIGGDIRLGMSYAEVFERITGTKTDREPSMMFSSDYTTSYAGALTRIRFQFDVEKDQLYLIGLDLTTEDKAAAWFELYGRFTELFGEPIMTQKTDSFTTPEELTEQLAGGRLVPAAAWGSQTKYLTLMLRAAGGREPELTVEMVWQDLMPGFAASQQG